MEQVITWLAQNWTGLLAVLFTFGFMIFVHELGHFIMAKRVGITVHEFALGFGPRLLRFGGNKRKKDDDKDEPDKKIEPSGEDFEPVKTEYCLRAVPLGGFVRMEGEDEQGDLKDPGNFNNKTVFDRFKTIVGGCVMNYITGIALLIFVGLIWGLPRPPAEVGALREGYPLAKTGVQTGDKIIRVNNTEISDFLHLSDIISRMKNNENITLTILRGDKTFTVPIQVYYDKSFERGMLGFSPPAGMLSFIFVKETPGEAIISSFTTTARLTLMPITIFQMILSKQMTPAEVAKGTAGPIGIGQMLFEVSKKGIPKLLYICAILSILIGAFNLFPFPALDGSRVAFLAVEWIRKKPVNPEKEGMVHQVGFALLILMVIVVTYNDIMRLIRGVNIFK